MVGDGFGVLDEKSQLLAQPAVKLRDEVARLGIRTPHWLSAHQKRIHGVGMGLPDDVQNEINAAIGLGRGT